MKKRKKLLIHQDGKLYEIRPQGSDPKALEVVELEDEVFRRSAESLIKNGVSEGYVDTEHTIEKGASYRASSARFINYHLLSFDTLRESQDD